MMRNKLLTLCPLILLLASCATNSAATKPQEIVKVVPGPTVDTACQWAAPIYISKKDVLTDETARQILAFDRKFVAVCGMPAKK